MNPSQLANIGAALSLVAYMPYAWAVLRGHARPQRSSWLIWSVLSSTALAAVIGSGGTQGIAFTASQTGGTVAIFLLSLWRGTGSLYNRADCSVIVASAVGIGLWFLTDNPTYAMVLSIGIGAMGGSLTVLKAYRLPASEAIGPWALQMTAAGFGVASVIGATALEMAYPIYLLVLYIAIVAAGGLGRIPNPQTSS